MGNKFVPIGIVAIAVLALLCVKPFTLETKQTNAQIKALQKESTATQAKIDKLNQLKPELEQYKDQVSALRIAMPAAQQIPEVLVMVEDIAKKTGLMISGVDIQPGQSGNEVGVNMTATGTYDNLTTFTKVLENNVRPIQIKTMSVSGGGTGSPDSISASVSLGILYQGKLNQQVELSQ